MESVRQIANLQKGEWINNGYSPTKVSSELTKSLEKVHINGDDDFRDDGHEKRHRPTKL